MRKPATMLKDLILVKNLEYGDVSEMSQLLEEVSKLREAYSRSILDSDF